MQTERVTFLTSPDHKAALDAFAASSGQSVGHVLREASRRYISGQVERIGAEEEAALLALAAELNETMPRMHDSLGRSNRLLEELHDEMDAFFHAKGVR